MRELTYTVLELEEWNSIASCYFCSNFGNKAVCQIRTRSKKTDKIIANSCACQECKEKFENNEIPKCNRCGRLEIKANILYGKHLCDCVRYKEDIDEKELPALPHERREAAFYERQINSLREEKNQLTEEVETHLEALEISEVWNKRQKQELLDEIKRLRDENERLKAQVEVKK
jgi:predicted RNase H-like nuclease (RuvC/YqgF family)